MWLGNEKRVKQVDDELGGNMTMKYKNVLSMFLGKR
jgi:hypothetical protein